MRALDHLLGAERVHARCEPSESAHVKKGIICEQWRDVRQGVMWEHCCHVRQGRIYWEHSCEARGAYMAKCPLGNTQTWRDNRAAPPCLREPSRPPVSQTWRDSRDRRGACSGRLPHEHACMPSRTLMYGEGRAGEESWRLRVLSLRVSRHGVSESLVMASPSL